MTAEIFTEARRLIIETRPKAIGEEILIRDDAGKVKGFYKFSVSGYVWRTYSRLAIDEREYRFDVKSASFRDLFFRPKSVIEETHNLTDGTEIIEYSLNRSEIIRTKKQKGLIRSSLSDPVIVLAGLFLVEKTLESYRESN